MRGWDKWQLTFLAVLLSIVVSQKLESRTRILIDAMSENGALAESPYGGSKDLPPCSCNFEITHGTH
ncbi:hypothetical protein GCM10008933_46900 [Paenibacillus motobuensis]|uniref:Uncharacterized protein n=1 Tax=Paenibacillus motobuensis TaxID=295324 RepID=A0ABP3IMW6_9BACL